MTAANQIVRSAKKVLAMEGRPHMTTPSALERPLEKRFGRCDIPFGAEQEIHRLPLLVDSSIEVGPMGFDLHVGFVDET